jgi:hypothetical protein
MPWRLFGLGWTQFDLTSPTQLLSFARIGLGNTKRISAESGDGYRKRSKN